MSGRLGLSTPWARQYLPSSLRPAVEAEIPDGYVLGISAITRPGHWRLWLVPDETGGAPLWSEDIRDHDLSRAALTALRCGTCWLCRRPSTLRVIVDNAVVGVCEECFGRADVEVPLSYEEHDGD